MQVLNPDAFEELVHACFPAFPVPQLAWGESRSFNNAVCATLGGKSWHEVVGWRLHFGETDLDLSIWMKLLPLETMCYYLPSHLMLASILLRSGARYMTCVMEAFLLPPSASQAAIDEIDEELEPEGLLGSYAPYRLALYHALTPSQRECIARFLDLYFCRYQTLMTRRGTELFLQNSDYWRNSSLPVFTLPL